jgi:DNA-binding winged helix-turn-helix (wHTH) protein/TolB-like protein
MAMESGQGLINLAREEEFSLGSVRVRPGSREVIADGRAEIFEPRVLQVLVALARRRGEVVSRDELSARCWEGRPVGDDALNRCIARIRKLAETSGAFTIETIPRVGYRLTPEPATGFDAAASPAPAAPAESPAPSPQAAASGFARRHARALIAGVVLLGVAALGVYLASRDSARFDEALDERTVIVLPFNALNDDADTRNFAQSISASVSNVLSQSGVRVVSPARAEMFRGAERGRAAEESGARFIIDGEVRRDGGAVRVVVRADDGRVGRTLWSNVFEGQTNAAAALSDSITRYIGGRAWVFNIQRFHSESPEVYEASFRTIDLMLKEEATAAYEVAAALARRYPDDLSAQALLASVASAIYWELPQDQVVAALRAGRDAARRVSAGAPNFGYNYLVLSNLIPPQQWARREQYLRKSYEVDPDITGGGLLPEFLVSVGRLGEAVAQAKSRAGRDPFNPAYVVSYYNTLRMRGSQEDALAGKKLGDGLWSNESFFRFNRFLSSDFRGAAVEANDMMRDAAFAESIEPAGQSPIIRQVLRALASRQPADIDVAARGCLRGWISYQTTVVCMLGLSELGRLDDAFQYASMMYPDVRAATAELEDEAWLRREKPMFVTYVLFRAELAPMRADPRFIELAERIRLLEYWRAGHPPDFCQHERVPVCAVIRQRPAG